MIEIHFGHIVSTILYCKIENILHSSYFAINIILQKEKYSLMK